MTVDTERMDGILSLVEREFGPFTSANNKLIHLNHAGVGPWPKRTHEAIARFSAQNTAQNKPDFAGWEHNDEALRKRLGALINANSTDEIAYIKNTSEGLSAVAYGLDWPAGSNVVFAQQEFPSNRILWEDVGARFDVELRCVDLYRDNDPEATLIAQIDHKTRLLSVSSVQYALGYKIDLQRLSEACKQHDALLCVDAIQSLGIVPMDVQALGVDFIAADAHKWMLAPEGVGLFYCRAEHLEQLKPLALGWASLQNASDYDALYQAEACGSWRLSPAAKRMEAGSPNHLGLFALDASLSLIEEVGVAVIECAVRDRVSYLIDGLRAQGRFEILSPTDEAHRAGIVTFALQSGDALSLYKALQLNNVLCAYRGGGVRLSPHFYTPYEDLDAVLAFLSAY